MNDSSSPDSPFEVPPFELPERHRPKIRFVWWSWHPNYPYWSKSCWEGATEEEAWAEFRGPACEMELCHNKLIREGDGAFTEVADVPCKRMDIWQKIRAHRQREEPQP